LQRCLYASAAHVLLNHPAELTAALHHLRAESGEQGLFPLADSDAALGTLAKAVESARNALQQGLALPGIDAGDQFNELVQLARRWRMPLVTGPFRKDQRP
jgi:hypothetical protein